MRFGDSFRMNRRALLTASAGIVTGITTSSFEDDTAESSPPSRHWSESTQSTEGWRSFKNGPGNTGHAPDQAAPIEDIEPAWTYNVGAPVRTAPAVVDGTVYLGAENGALYALDAETGDLQWRYQTTSRIRSPPVVAAGTVVFGVQNSTVYAMDATDGLRQWTATFGDSEEVSLPLAARNGRVFCGTNNSGAAGVYTFDIESGEKLWEKTVDLTGGPAVVDGTVYTPGRSDAIGLDSGDGSRKWRDGLGFESMTPTVVDNTVYFPTSRRVFVGDTGTEGGFRNDFRVDDGLWTSVSVAAGTLFGVNGADNVIAFSDGERGLDRTKWVFDPEDEMRRSPVIAGRTLFVGSNGGMMYGINASTGQLRWQYAVGDAIRTVPAVVDGKVFFGSDDGIVYALTGETSSETLTNVEGPPTTTSTTIDTPGELTTSTPRRKTETVVPTVTNKPTETETPNTSVTTTSHVSTTTLESPPSPAVTTSPRPGPSDGDSGGGLPIIDDPVLLSGLGGAFVLGSGMLAARRFTDGDDDSSGDSDVSGDNSSSGDFGVSEPQTSEKTDQGSSKEPKGGSPGQVSGTPAVSLTYDDFENGERIGTGGNADVYRAVVELGGHTTDIAVKEPRMRGTLDTNDVTRLLDEAKTWSAIDNHEHIVDIIDYGSEPLPWIAMEYMDGGHLAERVSDFSLKQSLWTALAITRGVGHAHQHGVAHLDIKPENVLFRSVDDGWDVPKVCDWGLSKELLDHSKSVEGLSPHYAAPEQFEPEYGDTDEITDIYQLGTVFYELFTGRPPYAGEPATVMHKVLTDRPPRPSRLDPSLPNELDELLLTALATNKDDRQDSVLYLRDTLAAQLDLDEESTLEFTIRPSSGIEDEGIGDRSANPETSSTADTSTTREHRFETGESSRSNTADTLSYSDIDITEPIKRGSGGTVSRAHIETATGHRPIALKELHIEETMDSSFLEQFSRAVDKWSKLDDSRGIVEVIDWDTQPAPWIALEYMDVGTLGDLANRMSFHQNIVAVTRIAEALHYAHTRGLSHLHLTPSDILFTTVEEDVIPKVSDWGLGKLALDHARSIEEITVGYMAPEQIDDGMGEPTQATDIYSLGAICYELFTGRQPYQGPVRDVVKGIVLGEMTAPTAIEPDLPDEIDNILSTAMAKEPGDRYESVLYLRDALQELL